MWLEPHRLLVIVLIIVIAVPRSSSSEKFAFSSNVTLVGNKSGPKQLGKHCLEGTGNPSFKELIDNKCYVDKTRYIDKLVEQIRSTYFFLTRPKKFGKTLLVDTMENFFKLDGSNELFKNTEIYQRRSGNWKRYPTIRLDFSKLFSSDSAFEFKSSLKSALLLLAESHDTRIVYSSNVEGMIGEFIRLLNKKHNLPVVVLVDEYDTPYTRSYEKNKDEASKILGTLQGFYSTLKGEYKMIHFCFVTGITRLALSDLFSGFNVAIDLTMDPEYAGIVGFNETELHEYFGDEIKRVASETGKKEGKMLEEMKTWHDGFRFTSKSESLFSPLSVIGYLRTKAESLMSWSDSEGSSKFLHNKLREFPLEALKLILQHETKRQTADSMLQTSTLITATRRELTGKINYEVNDFRALIALLFHSGYLSIESYKPETNVFTLKFSNRDVEEDYSSRIADIIMKVTSDIKEASIVSELEAFHWDSFIKRLDAFDRGIEYPIPINQREGLEAWFQFILSRILSRARKSEKVLREASTSKERADIVYYGENTTFIFEPKMSHNDENPVFECKEKYHKKYLSFDSKKDVVCIGLKFLYKGQIESWGVARFSCEGELLEESGTIRLTTQLSFKEQQSIRNKMKENPQCPLKPDKVIEFLEQIGPTTDDQLELVNKITQDPKTLCLVLEDIKQLVRPNLRSIINSVVKAVEQNEEERKSQKRKDQLSGLKKILSPVKDLYLYFNDFPIDFEKLTEFIYLCEKPKRAPLFAPVFTENIPKLLSLLERSHSVIKDRSIKFRITHICKNLRRKNSAGKSK